MAYDRINWENTPSHVTPLSAENLNTMDEAIDSIDEELNRVGVKAVNLEARMDTAETNIVGIGEELTEQDTYAKGMGAKTLVHETDIATLKSQVTQIIDGGPASPSELTDVRISENGTAYPTAGEAVRAQVRQMIEVQDTQPTDPGNKLWINDGSYDAEDHKVPTWEEFSELKEDLNLISDGFKVETEVDFTGFTGLNAYINTSNKWSVSTDGRKCHAVARPAGAEVVIVGANDSAYSVYAFLTADTIANQQTPAFCTGHQRVVVNAGDTVQERIPSDCQYIYVLKTSDGETVNLPETMTFISFPSIDERSVSVIKTQDLTDAEKALARSNINAADAAFVDKFNNAFFNEEIDASPSGIGVFINSSNQWSSSGHCLIYPIANADTLTVVANDTNNAVIAFLTTNSYAVNSSPSYATGSSRTVLLPNARQTFPVPSDALYVYIQKSYRGANNTPAQLVWALKNARIKDEIIPLGLHEKPANIGILNVIKRCRQMTDIKWAPAVDLPRLMRVNDYPAPESALAQRYEGVFKAGVTYTGVPYGRCDRYMDDYGYAYSFVGLHIGFDTFLTSVVHPKSKLSLESEFSLTRHETTIYAAVCSALTCYAYGVGYKATSEIPSITGLSLVGKITDNGVRIDESNFHLGDCLNLQGDHTAIITDIIRDTNGNIQCIELCDAAANGLADKNYADGQIGGLCRRKGWTIEQIYTTWGSYSIYRYSNIASVPYIPSPYVNIGDELDMFRIEHFPIMPYEGENFGYKSGHIPNDAVTLIIDLADYGYVRVFKDDTEIEGSPFTLTSNAENISIDEIGVGAYSAYLCNLSNGEETTRSASCHWSVIDA